MDAEPMLDLKHYRLRLLNDGDDDDDDDDGVDARSSKSGKFLGYFMNILSFYPVASDLCVSASKRR